VRELGGEGVREKPRWRIFGSMTCFFSANVKYLLGLRFFSDISAILFFDFATSISDVNKINFFKEEKSIWSKIVRLTHR
jgi:hypothetical protein